MNSMNMIRAILVDDESLSRLRLRRMLEREDDIEVIGECADGPSAVEVVREFRPNLLFLDVNMPGMDGFGVLEMLGADQPFQVIFVTADDEHAVRAFEACALDYLLKPISPERVSKAVARARARLAADQTNDFEPESAAPDESGKTTMARFIVRNGGRLSFVAAEDIDWVESAGNYAIFHVGKQNHMLRETMNRLQAQLPVDTFLRVSRSAIVNLRRVKEQFSSATGAHAAILSDGQRIPITCSLREVADRLSRL